MPRDTNSDQENHLVTQKLKVAYVLHRFPHLTETFIVRELHGVRKQSVDAEIFSLLSPRPGPVNEDARALLPYTHYSTFFSKEIIAAQSYFIRQSPHRYFRALWKVFQLSYREPGLLLRTLVVFPKSIYFARQMQDQGIKHIHAHFAWLGGIVASTLAELLSITYTIHPHAFDLFTRNSKAVRALLEDASQVVTISKYHRDYIVSLCPQELCNDVIVVHCGLDSDRFHAEPRQADNIVPLILSVASLSEKKGHEYLIDACALLAKHGISFHCAVVGDGSHQRHTLLQKRIDCNGLHERVTLLGPMKQEQIVELYHRGDIFVLPCVIARDGDRDGIPVVLMEAMACELPVVTTAVAGIPELVEDEVSGLIVRERDATSLATALERLLANKALREVLGKRGRQKVREDFSIQQSAEKLVSVFRQLDSPGDEVQCE